MNEEVWKPIPQYEGLYDISSYGKIRSYVYGRKKITKILVLSSKTRYIKVTLHKDGAHKTYWVHRLVAITFLPAPQYGQCVNHINGIKTDNRVENLCWCTPKENSNNPATKQNYYIRYHKEGEWQRRSDGQKRRFERERLTHTGKYFTCAS